MRDPNTPPPGTLETVVLMLLIVGVVLICVGIAHRVACVEPQPVVHSS